MAKADLSFKINQFTKEAGVITFKKAKARRPMLMVEYMSENLTLIKWMVKEPSPGQMETIIEVCFKQIRSMALES
jgi:hypothetical protein